MNYPTINSTNYFRMLCKIGLPEDQAKELQQKFAFAADLRA